MVYLQGVVFFFKTYGEKNQMLFGRPKRSSWKAYGIPPCIGFRVSTGMRKSHGIILVPENKVHDT